MAQNLLDFLPAGTGAPSGATMGGFSGMGPAAAVPYGTQTAPAGAGAPKGGLATILWSMVLLGTALFILHVM